IVSAGGGAGNHGRLVTQSLTRSSRPRGAHERRERPVSAAPAADDSREGAGSDEPAAGGVPFRTLIWLAVATFTTGIDGYVLAGLLPDIASDLEVSAAAAGQLVAVF